MKKKSVGITTQAGYESAFVLVGSKIWCLLWFLSAHKQTHTDHTW